MKKYIIRFGYRGFLFKAKVIVKRYKEVVLFSTAVIDNSVSYLLEKKTLIFMQKGNGFVLILFNDDNRTYELLPWKIKLEYVDKTLIFDEEFFSLS